MKFAEMETALREGKKIKVSEWKNAFWVFKDGVLINHDEDGYECPVTQMFPLDFLCVTFGDWEVVEEVSTTRPFGFGEALTAIKQGKKVARLGWNGKEQYIQLARDISYRTPQGEIVNCDHDTIGNKAIAFVGTSGVQMGWLASQADMLAYDWTVVE